MTIVEKLKSRGVIPKAVLYARFSSDNQREESIDAQLRALREYCERNGIVVIHEYCDRARSATTDDRPEFLDMIADSKTKDFDFIIVHKLDRFSRNRYDSAYYKRELKKNGVALISILEYMDDSPESIILESVLEGMSEYYSKNLAREVMKGMKESAMQCRAVGGRPPFGYKINPENHKYEIDEEEADAIRIIFQSVCDGICYQEIITELNHLGYRTRNNNPFGKNSIHEILRNEKYKGIYIFNRAVSHNCSRTRNNHKNKPEDEIIRIPGGMPALVDEDTFERVATIIKGRSRTAPNKRAKEDYLLVGKIFCGICGKSYNGNRQYSGRNKKLLITYRCGNKKNYGDLHCDNKDINRNYIEDFVFKLVGEIVFNEKRIPQLIKTYYDSCGELFGDCEKKLTKLRVNLKGVNQKIENIISVISKTGSPSLLESLETLEVEKKALILQIGHEEGNLVANKLNGQEIIAAYRRAQKMYEDGTLPQKKQLINLYLKQVTVFQEYVEIKLNTAPSNLLKPTQECQVMPADGEHYDIHILIELAKNVTKSHLNTGGTCLKLVEARGGNIAPQIRMMIFSSRNVQCLKIVLLGYICLLVVGGYITIIRTSIRTMFGLGDLYSKKVFKIFSSTL